jgi:hypothetical protein
MTNSDSHHFVPQWYQRQFLPPDGGEFFVLDKSPQKSVICSDGKVRPIQVPKSLFRRGAKKLFQKSGLYSLALRGVREDAIERVLFGQIDNKGAKATALFSEWPISNGLTLPRGEDIPTQYGHPSHRMMDLLKFMDAEKARTPKGIDQIKHA